jgi:CMP/dCMP kinase
VETSPVVIAIDGPAGSGKSTLARRLAAALGLPYVNTGAMYRAVTLHALRAGLDLDDGRALASLARSLTFDLDPSTSPPELRIDGAPPGDELTTPEIEAAVSRVARHPVLRDLMRDEQRRLGARGAVMEGRDIGSVVFPGASLRVVLGAKPEERAGRRALERGRRKEPEVERAIAARDEQDARNVPPLDADLEVDSTHLDVDAVFALVLSEARARIGGLA